MFYSRAAQPRAGGAPVFHDTTGGSNSVPGQTGFAAVVGYDQVNGLGSINASLLASQSDAATVCGTVKVAPPVVSGNHNSVALMVTVSGGFNASVAFSVAGLPRGLSATFPPVTLSAPGSGSGLLKITAPSGVRIGTLFCHCFSYQWEARSSGYHCPPHTRAYASFIANRDRGFVFTSFRQLLLPAESRNPCRVQACGEGRKGSKATILKPRPVPASRKPLRPDESGSPRS